MFPAAIDRSLLTPTSEMKGESDKETEGYVRDLAKAEAYIKAQKWCGGIEETYLGTGLGGVIESFLFRITPKGGADEWLWVFAGDVPCAYLVIDDLNSPAEAIVDYCGLMEDWIEAVLSDDDLDDIFPVDAPPTKANAEGLKSRIDMIRNDILPNI